MLRRLSFVLVCLVLLPIAAACGTQSAVQSPASSPTVASQATATSEHETLSPTAPDAAEPEATSSASLVTSMDEPTADTPVPEDVAAIVFEPGTLIAGVDVGDRDQAAAAALLDEQLTATLMLPLEIQVAGDTLRLNPADIDLELPIDELLTTARAQQVQGTAPRVPLRVEMSETKLRRELRDLAEETARPASLEIITATEEISRSFGYIPRYSINVDNAVSQVQERLASPLAARRITLERDYDLDTAPPRPDQAEIRQQIEALAAEWDGVVGFYLYNMDSGETITLNANTVFSAASIMKVGILIAAYATMPTFDAETEDHIKAMIIDSDNLRANDVLSASVGGTGTDAAYTGVLSMTAMLEDLGFQRSYMNMPYEAYDYLAGVRGIDIEFGPPQEGSPPYTEADPIVRTTPAEISQLFLMIEDCSQGEGALIERFPETLSAERCQEMLDLLAQNADSERIVAGVPPDVRVEHKSGWVQDMHADTGIVRSPGGDYLLSVYLWRGVDELPGLWANPYLVAFSRLVYTAYNPVPILDADVSDAANLPAEQEDGTGSSDSAQITTVDVEKGIEADESP